MIASVFHRHWNVRNCSHGILVHIGYIVLFTLLFHIHSIDGEFVQEELHFCKKFFYELYFSTPLTNKKLPKHYFTMDLIILKKALELTKHPDDVGEDYAVRYGLRYTNKDFCDELKEKLEKLEKTILKHPYFRFHNEREVAYRDECKKLGIAPSVLNEYSSDRDWNCMYMLIDGKQVPIRGYDTMNYLYLPKTQTAGFHNKPLKNRTCVELAQFEKDHPVFDSVKGREKLCSARVVP
jgi:hypothetical protein